MLTETVSLNELNQIPQLQSVFFTFVWQRAPDRQTTPASIARSMREAACGSFGTRLIQGGCQDAAWLMAVPNKPAPLTVWSVHQEDAAVCLFEGDLYAGASQDLTGPGEDAELASRLTRALKAQSGAVLEELSGVFAYLLLDIASQTIRLLGDNTGTHSIYWHASPDLFAVSNNLWAFRGLWPGRIQMDEVAVAEFLTLGIPMGGRTWLKGVRQLQHRQSVEFDARNGRFQVKTGRCPFRRENKAFRDSIVYLRESLDRALEDIGKKVTAPIGLGLSGGLDSRICLAALHSRNLNATAFSFCFSPEARDNRLGKAAAELVGIGHETVLLPSLTALALYRDLRIINEGESPGFGFFCLAAAASSQVDTLILGSELQRDTPLGPYSVWNLTSRRQLAEEMLKGQMASFSFDELQSLLSHRYQVTPEYIQEEWFSSFDGIDQDTLVDVSLEHQTDYRVQRRTRPRLESSRWFCQPIYPFLDNRVNRAFRSIPAEHLKRERAHLGLLESYGTGLERLPNAARSFTHVPVGWEHRLGAAVQLGRVVNAKVWEPLCSRFEHLKASLGQGRSRLVPYLLEDLESLQESGVFDPDALSALVSRAKRGTFLNQNALQALVSVGTVFDFLNDRLSGERSLRLLKVDGWTHRRSA